MKSVYASHSKYSYTNHFNVANSTLILTLSDFTPPASKISHFYLLSTYFLWERFFPKETGLIKENLPSPLSQGVTFFSKGSPIAPSHALSLQLTRHIIGVKRTFQFKEEVLVMNTTLSKQTPAVVSAQQCSSQTGLYAAETPSDPPSLSPLGLGIGLYIASKKSIFFFSWAITTHFIH